MDQDQVLKKIKKCLALASSSNPHEAAAAMRQAQALMRQYGLEEADVLAAEASTADARATAGVRPPVWESNLVATVCDAFGVEVIFRQGVRRAGKRPPSQWSFIGCGPAPEVASYSFAVLLRQVRAARTEYIQSKLGRCKPATRTRRADLFARAWVLSVREQVVHFAQDLRHKAAIDAYMALHFPNTAALTVTDRHKDHDTDRLGMREMHDLRAGFVAGRDVRLNQGIAGTDGGARLIA